MKKKKVLHVVNNLNCGGAENMIMNIYRNIDKEKIHFEFFCLSSVDGYFEEEIIKLGGNIHKVLPSENKLKKFFEILTNNSYDVVHSHVMFFSGIIQLIAKIKKVPIRITHSHSSSDMKKENFIRKIYIKSSRFLVNTFSNIKISCGEKAGKYLYGTRKKFIILKNGIDLKKFLCVTDKQVENLKKELGIVNEEFIIGHVGSFLEVKNQEFFINVAKELISNKERFKIVLVGGGEKFHYIQKLIKKENLEKYFVMPGIRKDIPVFMNMFDIFMMPSLYEGFPLSVVEALAGDNICYLSNNISKETDIIEKRVNFFDLNDSKKDLIIRIKQDLKNKKKIDINEKLTDAGFSIEKMTQTISEIYLRK